MVTIVTRLLLVESNLLLQIITLTQKVGRSINTEANFEIC